jgi:hypothetical protein
MVALATVPQDELISFLIAVKLLIGSAISALFLMLAVWIVAKIKVGYGKAFLLVLATYTMGTVVLYSFYQNGIPLGFAIVAGALANFGASVYLFGSRIRYPDTFEDSRTGDLGYPKAALVWLFKIVVPVVLLILVQLPQIIEKLSR